MATRLIELPDMDKFETAETWLDAPADARQAKCAAAAHGKILEIRHPDCQTSPIIFNSPHSGADYHPDFVARSALDEATLRRSEDAFVDELFAHAAQVGAPLVRALFPRAYLDVNREAFELDPAMFAEPLPAHVNTRSMRVAGGLGTIARVVSDGKPIYRDKLSFAEAAARIDAYYHPYHAALEQLLARTHRRFGCALLIDCHSMPSQSVYAVGKDSRKPEIILGDRYGTSCSGEITAIMSELLTELGYLVVHNNPYAGGFITDHYGRPQLKQHALQIEINRALYMDEERILKHRGFARLQRHLSQVISELSQRIAPDTLFALA